MPFIKGVIQKLIMYSRQSYYLAAGMFAFTGLTTYGLYNRSLPYQTVYGKANVNIYLTKCQVKQPKYEIILCNHISPIFLKEIWISDSDANPGKKFLENFSTTNLSYPINKEDNSLFKVKKGCYFPIYGNDEKIILTFTPKDNTDFEHNNMWLQIFLQELEDRNLKLYIRYTFNFLLFKRKFIYSCSLSNIDRYTNVNMVSKNPRYLEMCCF